MNEQAALDRIKEIIRRLKSSNPVSIKAMTEPIWKLIKRGNTK